MAYLNKISLVVLIDPYLGRGAITEDSTWDDRYNMKYRNCSYRWIISANIKLWLAFRTDKTGCVIHGCVIHGCTYFISVLISLSWDSIHSWWNWIMPIQFLTCSLLSSARADFSDFINSFDNHQLGRLVAESVIDIIDRFDSLAFSISYFLSVQ